MIQFLIHILSVVFTAFLVGFILVWIQRKFSKEPQYKITYEFKEHPIPSYTACFEDFEYRRQLNRRKWEELYALGAEGWSITCVMEAVDGYMFILQRETLHTS